LNGTQRELDNLKDQFEQAHKNEPAAMESVIGEPDRLVWTDPVTKASIGLVATSEPMKRLRRSYPGRYKGQSQALPWPEYHNDRSDWGKHDPVTCTREDTCTLVLTIEQMLRIQGVDPDRYQGPKMGLF